MIAPRRFRTPFAARTLAVLVLGALGVASAVQGASASPMTSQTVGTATVLAATAAVPAAATAVPDSHYQPVDPTRVMSMVPMTTASTHTLTIPNVPVGATAVQLNVTSTFVQQVSFVSVCAGGTPLSTCSATSALNPAPGVDTASSVLVALGGASKNQVTFYNNRGSLALIADVQGFYVPATGAQFVPQAPVRAAVLSLGPRASTTVTLPNVPAGATAAAINVTSTQTSSTSFVSVCPAGLALITCTKSSTMNPTRGRDVANFAVVKLGGASGNQLTVYNNAGSTAVIIDVNGYFDTGDVASDAGLYRPATPARVMNFQPMLTASSFTLTLPNVPLGATAVAMNLTSTQTSSVSYVSACPGGTTLSVCRATSASNPMPGVDTANNVMLELGGPDRNQVVVYNNRGTTSLIGDLQGFFVEEGSPEGTVTPLPPATLLRVAATHPFSSSSPWNTSLGSGASYESAGSARTAALLQGSAAVNSTNWSIAVYQATLSDPVATVTDLRNNTVYTLRVPRSAVATGGTDRPVGIIQPDGVTAYEFYKWSNVSTDVWTSTRVVVTDLRSDGRADGARASSVSFYAGLIRREELASLAIPHTLTIGIPDSMLQDGPIWPARTQDSSGATTYSGPLPMGSMIAIPPDVDLNALSLTPEGAALARTLQDYGAYVLVRSSSVALFCEMSCDANQAKNLHNDWRTTIYPLIRVVTNSTADNVAGGGTRRQAALPELQ